MDKNVLGSELKACCFDPKTGYYPEGRPESTEPVKDGFDHAADALRYLVVNLDEPYTATHRTYAAR